ncbi:MAG: hypothetical protein JKY56_24270 [Kofleriaceae bacterium]|nr:hypothetical protein [Kofleriaceae bacterium]
MKSLELSRGYLTPHRRMIIGRSLAAAFAGAVPLPFVDDWLSSSIERKTIEKIADAHSIDIDPQALTAIADGPEAPPKWAELVGGGLALRIVSKQWKKLWVTVLAAKRAKAAGASFEVATLFDHYCARLHVGMGLDAVSGQKLRTLIDKARAETDGALSGHLFRKGLVAAARSSVRAPTEIADLLSGGRIRKLLSRSTEIEATTEVDEALEMQLRSESSFLARSAAAIELQLAVERNTYLESLVRNFDRIYREASEEE